MARAWLIGIFAAMALALPGAAQAQVRTVDPNQVIDGDLSPNSTAPASPQQTQPQTAPADTQNGYPQQAYPATPVDPQSGYGQQNTDAGTPAAQPADNGGYGSGYAAPPVASTGAQDNTVATTPDNGQQTQMTRTENAADTYQRDDLLSAAEGVFGKGAEGLAGIIEKILKDQGQPNGYIAGREASGAFVFGLRYGSGILHHKIEGERPVYWTGPSVGFDVGGDAAKVFVLVYNLYNTQNLYRRFPQAEGRVYFVGGFSASYLRSGNIVLIPVRVGVGWRLGANIGYMKFSEKKRWLPF